MENNIPRIGEKYKHFKYDPNGEPNHHLYEIVGIARHTETEDVLVIYKPLYDLKFLNEVQADFAARPLSMFLDIVERDGYKGPRFIKVD